MPTPNPSNSAELLPSTLTLAAEQLPCGVCRARLDQDLTFDDANQAYFRVFGYTRHSAKEAGFDCAMFVIPPQDRIEVYARVQEQLALGSRQFEMEVSAQCANGSSKWVLARFSHEPEQAALWIVVLDISDRKQMEDRLRISEEEYRIAARQSGKRILRYRIENATLLQQLDSAREFGLRQLMQNVPASLIVSGVIAPESAADFANMFVEIAAGRVMGHAVVRMRDRRGGSGWYHWDYTTIFNAAKQPVQAILSFYDVTEQREKDLAYNRLELLSQRDTLTGLLNRSAFFSRLDALLADAAPNALHVFLILDLDGFKHANDRLGHQFGDKILAEVARDLADCLPEGDLIGRLGGDEFVFCLQNLPEAGMASARCAAVAAVVRRELAPGIQLSASLGAAIFPLDAQSSDALYRRADIALYYAKRRGCGLCELYRPGLEAPSALNQLTPIDSPPLPGRQRVMLIVDDLAMNRALLSGVFSPSFTVLEAVNGAEGLTLLRRQPTRVTVILLDLSMPVMDGFAFLMHKRADMALRDIPVIVITRSDEPENELRALELGADDLITSPFDPRIVVRRVESVLARYGLGFAYNDPIQREFMDLVNNELQGGLIVTLSQPGQPVYYISDSLCAYLGYENPSEFWAATGGLFSRFTVAEDLADATQSYAAQLKSRHEYTVEYRMIKKSGETVWMREAGKYATLPDGSELILGLCMDVTTLRRQDKELIESAQMLEFAFSQTTLRVWKLDFATRNVTVPQFGLLYENVPESVIASGMVHPDFAQEYRACFARVYAGSPSESMVLQQRLTSDHYEWYRVSLRCIFDERGVAHSAIGVTENLPGINAAKARFEREEQLRLALQDSLLRSSKTDLTANRLINCLGPQGQLAVPTDAETFYNGLLFSVYGEESRLRYHARFSREALLASHEKGFGTVSLEFPYRNDQGRIFWVSQVANLLMDPLSGHLYAFDYLRDIDMRKRWELALASRVEIDLLTYHYSWETARALIEERLAEPQPPQTLGVLAIVELSNLAQLTQTHGFEASNRLLAFASRIFSLLLDSEGILGRVEENRLVVFFPAVDSVNTAAAQLRRTLRLLYTLREGISIPQELSFTAGLTVGCAGSATLPRLLDEARAALASTHERALDYIAVYSDPDKDSPAPPRPPELPSPPMADAPDFLTGARTRLAYTEHLSALRPQSMSSLGVVFADINGLGRLNSEYGNSYGDELLAALGRVLLSEFSPEEVFRISGDEFVVLAANRTHEQFIARLEAAQAALEVSYPNAVSLGSTWADADLHPKLMIDHAESLMLVSKQGYYRQQEAIGARTRPQELQALRESLAEGRFCIYLQPKANAESGLITGAEALVRLRDPERGLVTPDHFIPRYEKQGIIRHLDFFVLEEALRTLARWRDAGLPVLPISVNFSRSTLLDPGALDMTQSIHSRHGVPLGQVEIEITESLGSIERATIARACALFCDQGLRLALDDFGSEYSSLSILAAIRFSSLKIDKSIINDIVTNDMSRLIAQSVINLCRRSNIHCVAEGVETPEQLALLRSLGCMGIQGYLLNKPLPVEDFERKYLQRK